MQPGERIIVITPGGGGWGRADGVSDKLEGGGRGGDNASMEKSKKSMAKTQGEEDSQNSAASWQWQRGGSWAFRVGF